LGTIRGGLSEFRAVCLQEPWHGHLDLERSTLERREQLKAQRWRLISTPECIAFAPQSGAQDATLRRAKPDRGPAALLDTSIGQDHQAQQGPVGRVARYATCCTVTTVESPQGLRVVPISCFFTLQAVTPPAKLNSRGQPQQLAGSLMHGRLPREREPPQAQPSRSPDSVDSAPILHAVHPRCSRVLVQRSSCSAGIRCSRLATTLKVMGLELCQDYSSVNGRTER
jgi:hypothetical protein